MAETHMSVTLLAHTQLSEAFVDDLWKRAGYVDGMPNNADDLVYEHASDGQAVALTAIRTCYSPLKPTDIVATEGEKYFDNVASDGGAGSDADRLLRQIVKSKHTSTLEHITFTFAVEGVSRALLAQLTRHRVGFSFSVQSQRYVKMGSGDKSGGFDYIVPDTIANQTERKYISEENGEPMSMSESFAYFMDVIQKWYDFMRANGVPAEDARAILPNASATNLTMTANLRALLDFYGKRRKGRGAQSEIVNLAERVRECVVEVEPWTDPFFEEV